MYTYEEKARMNLQEAYALLYGCIGKQLIHDYGAKGERALREATRLFGNDRGETLRKIHMDINAKINMVSLFTLFHDVPSDPRFRRELQEITPQERVSHTLICPMADVMLAHGQQEVGLIYCEEIHTAVYDHYAFDCGQTNLSMMLTQEGDAYCDFNIVLRPEDLPDELKPLCFEEYDPYYEGIKLDESQLAHEPQEAPKEAYGILCAKWAHYITQCAVAQLGAGSLASIRAGAEGFADAMLAILMGRAAEDGRPVDAAYLRDNIPFNLNTDDDGSIWTGYNASGVKDIVQAHICDRLAAQLPA